MRERPDSDRVDEQLEAEAVGWKYLGMAFPGGWGASFAVALATHNEKMWCLFARKSEANKLYYATCDVSDTGAGWSAPVQFTGGPARDCGAGRNALLQKADLIPGILEDWGHPKRSS